MKETERPLGSGLLRPAERRKYVWIALRGLVPDGRLCHASLQITVRAWRAAECGVIEGTLPGDGGGPTGARVLLAAETRRRQ